MMNQRVWGTTYLTGNINTLKIPRPHSIAKGVYILRCINMETNEEFTEKVIFL
jgi:hypothetical protein